MAALADMGLDDSDDDVGAPTPAEDSEEPPAGAAPTKMQELFGDDDDDDEPAEQGGGGGSQHTTLCPGDAERLIALGWAEWHPVATAAHPLVLVSASGRDAARSRERQLPRAGLPARAAVSFVSRGSALRQKEREGASQ